ncbi:VHS domain-containing protein [Diaporthe amygdali]|uniref:VHS domain-containing protein n=1 Tax=Phomopsis amygdali TaxID=1214568 RepID=UPI0022FDDBBB|nr:VHS domain-containing protein [Diaporthe amygdali]KAJ0119806.1 VHS domain-containing protein [Diaporthe amygdali]
MFSQKKPFSAVTVTVENLTSEAYEEDDLSGIPDLVEVVKLQATGPTEAARAIRKKLKYGSVHRQLRALTILDGLIQNAGPRFQRAFADEPLLERLRVCGTSDLSDPDVKKKCSELFRSWATEYKNTPGLERIAKLYKELPKRKQVVTQERSRVIRETENPFGEDEDEQPASPEPAQPSSSRSPPPNFSTPVTGQINSFSHVSSSKDKKKSKDKDKKKSKHRKFNLEAEKDSMKTAIAEASIAATNLMNALQSINREKERISENQLAVQHFEACKQLRRKILRYIHHVESEQWLGSLLHANDELVQALMTFEQLDRSIDADSDSDDELAEQAHMYRMMSEKVKSPTSPGSPTSAMAGLHIDSPPAQPPRPAAPPRPSAVSKPSSQLSVPGRPPADYADASDEEDEDENDPFADRNAVVTPKVERNEPAW